MIFSNFHNATNLLPCSHKQLESRHALPHWHIRHDGNLVTKSCQTYRCGGNLGCNFRKSHVHSNTGEFGGKMRTTQSDGPFYAVLRESKRESYCNTFESKYEVGPLTALNKFRFEKSPRDPVCLSTETDHTKTLELLTPVYHVRGWCTRSNIQCT